MNLSQVFSKGLVKENPIFRLLLGMCPTLAVTTAAVNGLGMGIAVTAVLAVSNVIISLIRNIIPSKIRIPTYIVVIASLVTVVDMLMNAYVPALHKVLGIFIPLIVVNCIILQRAEAFASQHGPLEALADGLGMGLGFAGALTILGSIREVLGAGTLFGRTLFGAGFQPMAIMILAPGAFLTLGLLIAALNYLRLRRQVPGGKKHGV